MSDSLPEGHAVVPLFELHLLCEGQAHCLFAHVEHLVDQSIRAVVLHAATSNDYLYEGDEPCSHTYYQKPSVVAAVQNFSI